MTPSIVGFKEPAADLHRHSPKIFISAIFISLVSVGIILSAPLISNKKVDKVIKTPPVIIQLENIPETKQTVTAPAPRLAIPIEVADDIMLDDITIESTNLGNQEIPSAPPPVISAPKVEEKIAIEEIYEFFNVEEQPKRLNEIAPVYPDAARKAGIEGTVFVRALVGRDGNVEKAEVLKGPELLHEPAIKAALDTKFQPAKQNDTSVKCWVQMSFKFVLE